MWANWTASITTIFLRMRGVHVGITSWSKDSNQWSPICNDCTKHRKSHVGRHSKCQKRRNRRRYYGCHWKLRNRDSQPIKNQISGRFWWHPKHWGCRVLGMGVHPHPNGFIQVSGYGYGCNSVGRNSYTLLINGMDVLAGNGAGPAGGYCFPQNLAKSF